MMSRRATQGVGIGQLTASNCLHPQRSPDRPTDGGPPPGCPACTGTLPGVTAMSPVALFEFIQIAPGVESRQVLANWLAAPCAQSSSSISPETSSRFFSRRLLSGLSEAGCGCRNSHRAENTPMAPGSCQKQRSCQKKPVLRPSLMAASPVAPRPRWQPPDPRAKPPPDLNSVIASGLVRPGFSPLSSSARSAAMSSKEKRPFRNGLVQVARLAPGPGVGVDEHLRATHTLGVGFTHAGAKGADQVEVRAGGGSEPLAADQWLAGEASTQLITSALASSGSEILHRLAIEALGVLSRYLARLLHAAPPHTRTRRMGRTAACASITIGASLPVPTTSKRLGVFAGQLAGRQRREPPPCAAGSVRCPRDRPAGWPWAPLAEKIDAGDGRQAMLGILLGKTLTIFTPM